MKKTGAAKRDKDYEVIDGDGEQDPLLPAGAQSMSDTFDVIALRERVARLEKLDDYQHLEFENLPEYMVLISITNAVFAVMIVLGAYWFIISAGDRITPLCKPYAQPDLPIYSFKKVKMKENMCYISTYCFWTYPILCPLAVAWVNWKNLVDKRIFYECLLNRIFLMQSRISYLSSGTFWFLLFYGIFAMSSAFYMDVGEHGSTYWKYKEVVFGMLAYFSACGAFLHKLFSQWSVNNQIISLSNFAYQDSPAALALMNQCTFIGAVDFEKAWCRVEELFERLKKDDRMTPELNTPELLQLTMDMHYKWKDKSSTFMETVGFLCGFWFMPRRYWVSRFLYFEELKDTRSWRFRFVVRFYAAFMFVSVALFCWGMFYTTSHYLLFQHQDMMPEDLRRLPAPHEAPQVVDRASRLIPRVAKTVRDHA